MTASPSSRALLMVPVLALAAWFVVLPLAAHDDDPKVLDRRAPVLGPGYRAGSAAGLGGPSAGTGFESLDINLLSWLPLNLLDGASSGNDCWGYVSPAGREYALMGTSSGTSFVEITDPANPVVVQNITGPTSLWRDIKTYDHYAYAVSEGGDGIQVIDLANIDSGTVTLVNTIITPGTTSTHNVGIDEVSGFLYRFGGSGHGARIYDLANPALPVYVASWDERYIHDAQAVTYTSGPLSGMQIMYACGGLNGGKDQTGLTIVDVTDKSNIVVLDQLFYPNPGYSHQGWLSPDRQYFYLGDELDEDGVFPTTVYVIDVSDPTNASTITSFTNGNAAITHNLYTKDNLIYAANYRSGMRVFDATDPLAPVEVAWFDTFPADDGASFNGLWNCYPYFPSGTIIGSDLESGLFVWEMAISPIDILLPNGAPEVVDPDGDTAAVTITEDSPGDLLPGSAVLFVDDGGGFVSYPLTDLGGGNFEAPFPALPCGTELSWYLEATDLNGKAWTNPGGAPSFSYASLAVDGLNTIIDHDMELNQGWTSGAPGDNASTGLWVRLDPRGTAAQPEDDHTPSGTNCWVTGQGSPGGSVGENDVDNGHTTLVSPLFDLTGLDNPSIAYWRWYSNDQGGGPNEDVFRVDLSADGGTNWSSVEIVGPSGLESAGGWYEHRFRVSDVLPPSSQMVLRFIAEDVINGSIVEAAIDDVRIVESVCDTSVGRPFCDPAAVNSTGLPGIFGADGSRVLTDDDLTGHAAQLPTGEFAILLVSDRRGGASAPSLMGGGMSRIGLCVGAPFAAFQLTAGVTDGAGEISFPIDTGAIPTWQGPVSALPGETWFFQATYRDGGPMLFTNGLSITFQ